MATAIYDTFIAWDQILKRGIPGQVARVTDATNDLPVDAILDLDGNPIVALVSNSQGYVPPFQVVDGPPLVKITVGPVTYVQHDYTLMGQTRAAAEAAAIAAQQAASLVEAPADDVVAMLAGNPASLTHAAMDSATGAMIEDPGSVVQSAGDTRWLPRSAADTEVAGLVDPASASGTSAALKNGFIQRLGNRGVTRTLYVRATGNDSNPGTLSAPFREIKAAVSSLSADGPVVRGSVVIDVGPGTYKGGITFPTIRGQAQDDFIKIIGPDVGGHPNVPTAVIDYALDTTASWGIIAQDGAHVWLQDLKFIGGFGTSVRVDRLCYLQYRNVHIDGQGTAAAGLAITNQCRYFVTGGIIENCANGVQENFHITRGYGTVASASQQLIIRNCGIGLKAKENCVGHLDNINIEDCSTGIQMQLYSGANMKQAVFKRNGVGIVLTNSEIHNETSIAWGTGADVNGRRILSVGNSSELTLLGWSDTGDTAPTLRTGHRPLVTLASDYTERVMTGFTTEQTIISWPSILRADWYAIKGKRARFVAWGTTGSSQALQAGFRVILRVNASFAAEVTLPAGLPALSHFAVEFDMVATADGAAQRFLGKLTAGDKSLAYTAARTIDVSGNDRTVALSAIAGNAADSVTFNLAEIWG